MPIIKIARLLAALSLVLLFASEASATSTCTIREYAGYGLSTALAQDQPNIAKEPGVADQTIDFTSGHAESAAFNVSTRLIAIICDTQASYVVGSAPVAVNTKFYIPALQPWVVGVDATNNKISFVARP